MNRTPGLTRIAALLCALLPGVGQAGSAYESVLQPGLDSWKITPEMVQPLVDDLADNPLFRVREEGRSFLGTPIRSVTIGSGETVVLLWSQMHGDEPTATAALFDLFNYIAAPEQAGWRQSWEQALTLVFVPMLNPDGSARYSRFNAQGIDINRDAKQLQTPEGRILMRLAQELEPRFGFNLHDQSRHYAAGDSGLPATISLLAPAYNKAREINAQRGAAMQLIAHLDEALLQDAIPGQVARYDDSFSDRAFGDTLATMDIATVLIESGGYRNDFNRQLPRRLNFEMLRESIDAIADGRYQQLTLARYNAIPMNARGTLADVVLRGVEVSHGSHRYRVDLAIDRSPYSDAPARMTDIGDLRALNGYTDTAAAGLQYTPGKPYVLDNDKPLTLDDQRYRQLLRQGFSWFEGDAAQLVVDTRWPVLVNPNKPPGELPARGAPATFLLQQDAAPVAAVLDGVRIDL